MARPDEFNSGAGSIRLDSFDRGIPWIYSWRNRRKFFHWYRELENLESEMTKNPDSEKMMEYRGRLDRIEAEINRIRVPVSFLGEVWKLKEHVDSVRGKLARLNGYV